MNASSGRFTRRRSYPTRGYNRALLFAPQHSQVTEEFVTGARPLPSPDRFLGTVLFVDVAGST